LYNQVDNFLEFNKSRIPSVIASLRRSSLLVETRGLLLEKHPGNNIIRIAAAVHDGGDYKVIRYLFSCSQRPIAFCRQVQCTRRNCHIRLHHPQAA